MNVASAFPIPIASFSSTEPLLPYLDHSIDIVLVSSPDSRWFAEAQRVAQLAVVCVEGGETLNESLAGRAAPPAPSCTVEWQAPLLTSASTSVSIVVAGSTHSRTPKDSISFLLETLPQSFSGEIMVVGDESAETRARPMFQRPVRFLPSTPGSSIIAKFNSAAREAGGELVVFLTGDTIGLRGWLPPLLRTFHDHKEAGAAGGKLCDSAGRLQHAGGVVCADGSLLDFGKGDAEITNPLYNFVREVDACCDSLFATRRALFSEVGGFDPRYQALAYAVADYSFRLNEQGCRVFYQPEAIGIRLGAEAPSAGELELSNAGEDRAKFVERWSHRLKEQPALPGQYDRAAWYGLALRHSD